MQRLVIPPRPNWEEIVRSQGLTFHLTEGRPYWYESACYLFTAPEIDAIEAATYALDKMCLSAAEHVIETGLFYKFGIPDRFASFIRESWERDERTVYGRFDLACDGKQIKLMEYNADTPTGLIEAAVSQWFWLQDVGSSIIPGANPDQFNRLHERLIEAWAAVKSEYAGAQTMYFAGLDDQDEDFMTLHYLRDTAIQAGLRTEFIEMSDIGWNVGRQEFLDLAENPIRCCFKLYPWEWMVHEPFAVHLARNTTCWLEAPWKMVLSNKALLPILYSLFPDSPYLLPAYFEADRSKVGDSYVRKPLLGREGANTTIVVQGETRQETEGPYAGEYIYQQYTDLPDFGGSRPVVGSWMVNGYACGIGIREEDGYITTNQARFVPHLFVPEGVQ